jgi:2-methylcitrate dehydratase PrpD
MGEVVETMNGFDMVVNFVRNAKWDIFSPEVQEKAKICLLDGLCAVISGGNVPITKITNAYAKSLWNGANEATILRDGSRSTALGASLVNAAAGNALDIDDGCRHVFGHPGAQLIPVAMAVTEQRNKSGIDFLTALVIGFEVAIRIGKLWHKTHDVYQACGSWGSVANAATAARLMDLDFDKTKQAMGIAEYHAPNLPMMSDIDHPTMAKHGIPWGAVTGVMAAGMAEEGYTGVPSILGDPEHLDWVSTIGKDYLFVPSVTFKHFASCLWSHPPIMAARDLMRNHKIKVEDIKKIKIRGFHQMVRLGIRYPKTEEEAQFSVSWPLAAFILEGEVGTDQMLSHRFDDQAFIALIDKMELVEDEALEAIVEPGKWPVIVEITVNHGETFISDRVTVISGFIGDDLGPYADLWRYDDIKNKFAHYCGKIFDSHRIEKIINRVDKLDQDPNISELIQLCSVK